jgi:hypothetical protein
MAGAFRRKNAQKIFKRLSKSGYKAKRIANKVGYFRCIHLWQKQNKARNSEGQSRSLAFDQSL